MRHMQIVVGRAAQIGLILFAVSAPRFAQGSETLLDRFRAAPLPADEATYLSSVESFSPHVIETLLDAESRFKLRRLLRKAEPQCAERWQDCWYLYEIGRHLFAAQVSVDLYGFPTELANRQEPSDDVAPLFVALDTLGSINVIEWVDSRKEILDHAETLYSSSAKLPESFEPAWLEVFLTVASGRLLLLAGEPGESEVRFQQAYSQAITLGLPQWTNYLGQPAVIWPFVMPRFPGTKRMMETQDVELSLQFDTAIDGSVNNIELLENNIRATIVSPSNLQFSARRMVIRPAVNTEGFLPQQNVIMELSTASGASESDDFWTQRQIEVINLGFFWALMQSDLVAAAKPSSEH